MTYPVTPGLAATPPDAPAPLVLPPRLLPPRRPSTPDGSRGDPGAEPVVLLDARGRPSGAVAKSEVHHRATPLHLAFSCHVVAPSGRVLLTRRAAVKRTWPATWTNACCGHPRPGETLRRAVERRLREELGLVPRRLVLALPDFAYRAVMDDGTVEHELCPVVVAEVDGAPRPDPGEVDDVGWVDVGRGAGAGVRRARRPQPVVGRADRRAGRRSRRRPWRCSTPAPAPAGSMPALSTAPPASEPVPEAAALGAGLATRSPSSAARSSGSSTASSPTGWPTWPTSIRPRPSSAAEVRHLIGAGGKRLRPAFAYWGHRATGAAHDDGVIAAAAARRAAAHLRPAPRRRHGPVGRPAGAARPPTAASPRPTGATGSTATPAGSASAGGPGRRPRVRVGRPSCSTRRRCRRPPLARARRVFARLRTEVIAGQYLDLRLAAATDAAAPATASGSPAAWRC